MKKSIYILFFILPLLIYSQNEFRPEIEFQKTKSKSAKIKAGKKSYKVEYLVPKNWGDEFLENYQVIRLSRFYQNGVGINFNIQVLENQNFEKAAEILDQCLYDPGVIWNENFIIQNFTLGSFSKKAGLKTGDLKDDKKWCKTLEDDKPFSILYERDGEIEVAELMKPNKLVQGGGIMSSKYQNFYQMLSYLVEEMGKKTGIIDLDTYFKIDNNIMLMVNSKIGFNNYDEDNEILPEEAIATYSELIKYMNNSIVVK